LKFAVGGSEGDNGVTASLALASAINEKGSLQRVFGNGIKDISVS
jgi:hypothetical protein